MDILVWTVTVHMTHHLVGAMVQLLQLPKHSADFDRFSPNTFKLHLCCGLGSGGTRGPDGAAPFRREDECTTTSCFFAQGRGL